MDNHNNNDHTNKPIRVEDVLIPVLEYFLNEEKEGSECKQRQKQELQPDLS
jgi:hypothetical protein